MLDLLPQELVVIIYGFSTKLDKSRMRRICKVIVSFLPRSLYIPDQEGWLQKVSYHYWNVIEDRKEFYKYRSERIDTWIKTYIRNESDLVRGKAIIPPFIWEKNFKPTVNLICFGASNQHFINTIFPLGGPEDATDVLNRYEHLKNSLLT